MKYIIYHLSSFSSLTFHLPFFFRAKNPPPPHKIHGLGWNPPGAHLEMSMNLLGFSCYFYSLATTSISISSSDDMKPKSAAYCYHFGFPKNLRRQLPRPCFYTGVNLNSEQVVPLVSIVDPLLKCARSPKFQAALALGPH